VPGLLDTEVAPDFSDPIGLLEACHGRIAQHCELLQRMCEHQDTHGADPELADAAGKVLRYFDIAAPHHHADEERDLFPALAGETDLAELIAQLQAEHEQHDRLWQTLRQDLHKVTNGQVAPALRQHTNPFVEAYLQHAEIENQHILPRARSVLDTETLAAIGTAMATRRQN